jgi:arylsulfatase A-like enzyme
MSRIRMISPRLFAFAAAAICATGVLAQQSREILPIPNPPFAGKIDRDLRASVPDPVEPVRAPEKAPNVFLFMSDDVGFAMAGSFGGPVPTPNLDRLAKGGLRYNRFHTTGICSPSRAALLTGRNHHHAGFGYLSDLPDGYPGYHAEIPRETASIAEILKLNGYNTAMFGKTHNVTHPATSAAGPFDQWPTGQGFEYFFGLVGGDTDQYRPALYRGTVREADLPEGAPMLEKRMADETIAWLHNQQAAAPDKPFFIYYAPGSTHAPHQAPRAYIDRFKGKFDQGWDKVRTETWQRQRRQGIIPGNTQLTPRPPEIPAWDSVSTKMQAFAARTMESAAGMLAYQDEQLGRILDEMERTGEGANLMSIIVIGDNGASSEAGIEGTINELGKINGNRETEDWLYANIDKLGGPLTYPSYPAGWAWAMNTPLRWTKQFTSMLGGIRNGMIMNWNGYAAKPGSVCPQFGHVIDIAPTILDAAGLPAPKSVNGVPQQTMDGISLLSSLKSCAPDAPRTQYFEIGGKLGLWHNGWWASRDDGRLPWQMKPPGNPEDQPWTLYNLSQDFSQSRDVAAKYPGKLRELIALWEREARANNIYPLNHNFGSARASGHRPSPRTQFDYWGKEVSVQMGVGPQLAGRSFSVEVALGAEAAGTSGVLVALGSRFAGWSLYLDKGRPVFTYVASTHSDDIVSTTASRPIVGKNLTLKFLTAGPRKQAAVSVSDAEGILASGIIKNTFLIPAGLGETLDIGRDTGVPVVAYTQPLGAFPDEILHVRITLAGPEQHGGH